MKSLKKKTAQTILWIARIWGGTILAFFLFFVIAHLFGNEHVGNGFSSNAEVVMFLFFPVGTCFGLALALRWEGIGGIVCLLSLTGLLIMRPDLVTNPYFLPGVGVPATLYIIYWLLSRRMAINHKEISNH